MVVHIVALAFIRNRQSKDCSFSLFNLIDLIEVVKMKVINFNSKGKEINLKMVKLNITAIYDLIQKYVVAKKRI